jgi:hypothetical protein
MIKNFASNFCLKIIILNTRYKNRINFYFKSNKFHYPLSLCRFDAIMYIIYVHPVHSNLSISAEKYLSLITSLTSSKRSLISSHAIQDIF